MTQPDTGPTPDAEAGAASPLSIWAKMRARFSPDIVAVVAGTVAFGAACLAFLVITPTYFGPDETYHVDRVIAAEHGQIVLRPEAINVSLGARGIESTYIASYMHGGNSWASYHSIPRAQRPSVNALGGNSRSPARDVSNYETQHPPLYYAVMGGLVRLWPNADAMAGDKFVMLLRVFNILLMMTLPLLFWLSARWFLGDNPISRSAAFLPLLIPGLARSASTVNNDNLVIPLGALALALAIRVFMGDRTVRTAVVIAVTATAGMLTKFNVIVVLWTIPVAYFVQYRRTRALPSRQVFVALGAGAVASSIWWVHNYVAYGAIQPSAWGSQFARAQGPPRGNIPIDYHYFWNNMYLTVASRFWGALGLLEPPKLPHDMMLALTIALFLLPFVTFAAVRGRRSVFAVVLAAPVLAQLSVIVQGYLHFRHYLAIPGIQGRYVYPAVFGVLVSFAVGAVLLLRKYSSWAPLLIFAIGTIVSGAGIFKLTEYTWLPRGQVLRPSDLRSAWRSLASFSPLGIRGLLALVAFGSLLFAVAVVGCVYSCWSTRRERYGWAELRGPSPEPRALAPAA
ncbi:MAG TPA: DUF2142 domain-containing protein [Jatrophihabitantaceae bacterium]|nr:DUF2142 domain-containing protein [Jatrophihabitantaceae bacterium]